MTIRQALVMVAGLWAGGGVSCGPPDDGEVAVPELLTTDLPFRYPEALFAARVEGEVGLHLYVDSLGLVVPESTRVAEPSVHAEFDSAATAGAPYLEFRPAQRGAARIGHAVLLPVKFRLPPADSTAGAGSTAVRRLIRPQEPPGP